MFYEFGTILSSGALSKVDCHSHNLHVKYVCVKTDYSGETWDTPRCLHLSLLDIVLTFEIKLYTVFRRSLAHINIMKRRHAALIFKKESHKSKLKSANTKIYL